MNKIQKIFIVVAVVIMVVVILIFTGTIGARKPGAQSGNITIWGFDNENIWTDSINKYKSSESKVNITYRMENPETFESDLINAIARGGSPDIVVFPSDYFSKLKDILSEAPPLLITEREITQQFIDAASSMLTPKNEVAGMPLSADSLILYFNKDLFTQNFITLPPTTWNEFLDVSQKITRKDPQGNILISGAALGRAANIKNALKILESLFFEFGEKIVDESGNIILKSESPLIFFTDFANPQKVSQSWSPALPEAKDLFVAGKLGMYLGLISEYNDIKTRNPHLSFGVSLIPKLDKNDNLSSSGRLFSLVVPRASRNQFTAWNLVKFLTSAENSASYAQKINNVSPRRDLLQRYQNDSVKSVFAGSVLGLTIWPIPEPMKTNQIFKDLIENVATGKMTTREALEQARGKLEELKTKN